jgi:hypothetical protein
MMKKPSDGESAGSGHEFRDFVLGLLPPLGLSVQSVEAEGRHAMNVTAKSGGAAGPQKTVLIEALQHKRRVGRHALELLKHRMDAANVQDGMFLSVSGFTDDAKEWAKTRNINLITPLPPAGSPAPSAAPHPDKPEHSIFERVFQSSMEPVQAAEHFERRKKKMILGLFGDDEKVAAVEARFAPVGCFLLRKTSPTRASPMPMRLAEGENLFHVNLNTCVLYYLSRSLTGAEPVLRSTNLLRRLMDLDEDSVRILSSVVDNEELLFDRMDPRQQEYLEQNIERAATLEQMGLIGLRKDAKGYLSGVNLPKFQDKRFDLTSALSVQESVESPLQPDEMLYPPHSLLNLLSCLFNADGEFKGVTYLPYYRCKFASADGRIRFEVKETFKPKNA